MQGASGVRLVAADLSNPEALDTEAAAVLAQVPPVSLAIIDEAGSVGMGDTEPAWQQFASALRRVSAVRRLLRGRFVGRIGIIHPAAGLLGAPGQAARAAMGGFLSAVSPAFGAPEEVAVGWESWGADGPGLRDAGARRIVGALLGQDNGDAAIMPFDERRWVELYPAAGGSPFWSGLSTKLSPSVARTGAALQSRLLEQASEKRLASVLDILREQVGDVLRRAPGKIDPGRPFRELGLDSIMSLELRNRLERKLGLDLSVTVLFGYPNLAALSEYVLERLIGAPTAPSPPPATPTTNQTNQIEGLANDDLIRLVDQQLQIT
jgi:acyl carrier protein